ncbi:MAG: hypothetical protein AVDCRST_MAG73-3960, partial [uncultured Thermomicrobiales bacterium]
DRRPSPRPLAHRARGDRRSRAPRLRPRLAPAAPRRVRDKGGVAGRHRQPVHGSRRGRPLLLHRPTGARRRTWRRRRGPAAAVGRAIPELRRRLPDQCRGDPTAALPRGSGSPVLGGAARRPRQALRAARRLGRPRAGRGLAGLPDRPVALSDRSAAAGRGAAVRCLAAAVLLRGGDRQPRHPGHRALLPGPGAAAAGAARRTDPAAGDRDRVVVGGRVVDQDEFRLDLSGHHLRGLGAVARPSGVVAGGGAPDRLDGRVAAAARGAVVRPLLRALRRPHRRPPPERDPGVRRAGQFLPRDALLGTLLARPAARFLGQLRLAAGALRPARVPPDPGRDRPGRGDPGALPGLGGIARLAGAPGADAVPMAGLGDPGAGDGDADLRRPLRRHVAVHPVPVRLSGDGRDRGPEPGRRLGAAAGAVAPGGVAAAAGGAGRLERADGAALPDPVLLRPGRERGAV